MTKPLKIRDILLGEGMPKICVPITAKKREALLAEARGAAGAGADLVEWRADFYEGLGDQGEMEKTLWSLSDVLGQVPLLFTIRTKKEGGSCQISTEDYIKLNLWAARSKKADLLDVEAFGEEKRKKELIQRIQEAGGKVIASAHDFEKTDGEDLLLRRFQAMEGSGADILKLAVMPGDFQDVVSLMSATCRVWGMTSRPLISMSMGSIGAVSRIAGESFGSCLTFGTVGAPSAPGQLPIERLRIMLETLHQCRSIT
ncbi:MAG: type I 3-dehydroquinate dehydratase [Eubacteriales bacterium]|nr:type I 3-dehydroquinate dehydratase [Eubacteriales bacterium]